MPKNSLEMERNMKLVLALASGFVGLAASTALAHTDSYFMIMSGAQEVIPNPSPGVGTGTVDIDHDLVTMHVTASFSGLLGTTSAAHIHAPTMVPLTGAAAV